MEANPAINLKPLGMGQIIDRAVRLYRQNFLQYVGIVALAQIPMLIYSATLPLFALGLERAALDAGPEPLLGLGLVSVVSVIVGAILTQVAVAAMSQAIADTYLGRPTGIIEAFSRIGRAWIQLLLALLLAGFFMFLLLAWTIIPCVGWLTGPGMLIFAATVAVPLIVPVVVMERCSATEAVGRAWQLARRRFWWLLGFMLLLSILSQIVVTGPSLLLSTFLTPLAGSNLGVMGSNIIQMVSSSLLSVLYLPLYTACVVLLYFDVRVRTEALDLAMLAAARQEETAVAPLAEPETASSVAAIRHLPPAPAATRSAMPSQDEWVYFIAISVGIFVLYFLLLGLLMLLIFSGAAIFSGLF
jgi:hypothetical protein